MTNPGYPNLSVQTPSSLKAASQKHVGAEPSSKRGFTVCPDCKVQVGIARIESHKRNRCPKRLFEVTQGLANAGSIQPPAQKNWPTKTHPAARPVINNNRSAIPAGRVKSALPYSTASKCPHCGEVWQVSRLTMHMAQHNISGQDNVTSRSPSTSIRFEDEILSSIAKEDRDIENQLDGSRGWDVFRDHGQFGSFPSFDDMSDEASP